MMESLGLAAASETPIVIVDVMRVGPSTGIATKSEQSDLNIAVYGLHGDADHVVVAPLSVSDCVFTAQWAVHIAETLQTPVVVLSDQSIGQANVLIDIPADVTFLTKRKPYVASDENYLRYGLTADGVSPMALPGQPGGQYTADGLTHTQRGSPSSARVDQHEQMIKRANKIEKFDFGGYWGVSEGDAASDTVILTWGSMTGAAREALDLLSDQGISARLVSLRQISPFPTDALQAALNGAKRVLVVEQSFSGQFYRHVRSNIDLPYDLKQLNREGPYESDPMKLPPRSLIGKSNDSYQNESQPVHVRYHTDLVPGVWRFPRSDVHHQALANLGRPPEEIAVISGIGCSSRIPAYTNCYGFHGVHGRSLAVAAGLKVARPDLTVMAMSGDGDGFSIGGNHFLHACRRNVDMTYVVMDNRIYGMTKGQPSPTTEPDWDTALSPGGTGLSPFHPLVIALASGANFVAREFSGNIKACTETIKQAIEHPGFSFVQILSPCVTFRPDEKEWKNQVHEASVPETDDPARAARRIMTDDGMNTGILYRGHRKPYFASVKDGVERDLRPLEKAFEI